MNLPSKPRQSGHTGVDLAARNKHILKLSRGGLTNVQIAARVGMHPSHVGIIVRQEKQKEGAHE